MVAEVIPLKRLPRHLGVFDYDIPQEMEAGICIGQLVEVPFRTSNIYGIISHIKKEDSSDSLKGLHTIINEQPFFTKNYIEHIALLAGRYGVSYGTMLNMCMPPLQKKKLQSLVIKKLSSAKEITQVKPDVVWYATFQEHADHIQTRIKKTTLIIVPEQGHIDEIISLLPEAVRSKVCMWHSRLSTKEQFTLWKKVRNQECDLIIGTRGALFLPFVELESIIIDYEHDVNHKHADQAPRFHVKDIARGLAELYGATVTYMSFSPSLDSYLCIQKGEYTHNNIFVSNNKILFDKIESTPTVIQKTIELGSKLVKPISEYAEKCIESSIVNNEDIFIMINKKDDSTEYKIEHKDILKYRINTRALEQYFSKLQKQAAHYEMIRIERDTSVPDVQSAPRLIIGTTAALPYINWEKTKCIIWLEIDRQLSIAELSARENTWHLLHYFMYRKNKKSELLIESAQPDHIIFKSLTQPDRFYRTELSERKEFNYPPYCSMVRYFYGNTNKTYVQKTVEKIREKVKDALTNMDKGPILTNQFELYGAEKGMFWQGFAIKYTHESAEFLTMLNTHIPEDWKIDPFPLSLTHL